MKRVLIIDDEEAQREVVRRFIENLYPGVETEEGVSGYELKEKIRASSFDVALVDQNMDGLPGKIAIQELRQEGCKTPMIMVCSSSVTEEQLPEIGAQGLIEKPYKMATFKETLDQYLL